LTSKRYRFWNPNTNRIIESSDYTIDKCSGKYGTGFPPDPDIT
jgi:hypothetical protein